MNSQTATLLSLLAILETGFASAADTKEPTANEPRASVPTRLITGDMEVQLNLLRGKLSINSKDRDAFGLFQKPGKEPPALLIANRTDKPKTALVPFSAIVEALSVAAVMPSEGMFMVGSRSLRVGQTVPVAAAGQNIKVRIESVNSTKIVFRNLADNQLASKNLNILPEGVTAGLGTITVPGLTPTNGSGEELLEIDVSMPPAPPKE